VVPPGGSAHILQNDRLSVQHLACHIHNTEVVGKKLRSDHYPNYQHGSKTLTTVQSLLHHITPIMSRLMERKVVRAFLYPMFLDPPPSLAFSYQFAFRPTDSTSAAIISLLHTVINLLQLNPFVVVISLDCSKAFNTI